MVGSRGGMMGPRDDRNLVWGSRGGVKGWDVGVGVVEV